MKGLRNGISCSTGSELTLAIVRSYYRLLAAKADNVASRSGKTQAFINSISRRKSLLAVRVNVSVAGVVRDLCLDRGVCMWITEPHNSCSWKGPLETCLLLCPVGFSMFPRWTLHNPSEQPVLETTARERREIYFSAPQLLPDLLFVVALLLLLSILSCVDVPGTRRQ